MVLWWFSSAAAPTKSSTNYRRGRAVMGAWITEALDAAEDWLDSLEPAEVDY